MNAQRLLFLADQLDENAADEQGMKFDLEEWFDRSSIYSPRMPQRNCSTTGCAIGLAVLTPEFQQQGFSWKPATGPCYDNGKDLWGHGWDAVEKFFDITYHESLDLFDFGKALERKDPVKGAEAELRVAARIREFVSQKEKENV